MATRHFQTCRVAISMPCTCFFWDQQAYSRRRGAFGWRAGLSTSTFYITSIASRGARCWGITCERVREIFTNWMSRLLIPSTAIFSTIITNQPTNYLHFLLFTYAYVMAIACPGRMKRRGKENLYLFVNTLFFTFFSCEKRGFG